MTSNRQAANPAQKDDFPELIISDYDTETTSNNNNSSNNKPAKTDDTMVSSQLLRNFLLIILVSGILMKVLSMFVEFK